MPFCQGGRVHLKGSSNIGPTVFSTQLRLGRGRPGATEQPGVNWSVDAQPNRAGKDERLVESAPAQSGQVQRNRNNEVIVCRLPCTLLLGERKMMCRESGECLPGSHISLILKPEDALTERLGRAAWRTVCGPCARMAKTGRLLRALGADMVGSDSGGKRPAAAGAERGVDDLNPALTLQAKCVVRRKTDGAVEATPRIQHGECCPSRGAEPVKPPLAVTLLSTFDCPSPWHMKISQGLVLGGALVYWWLHCSIDFFGPAHEPEQSAGRWRS